VIIIHKPYKDPYELNNQDSNGKYPGPRFWWPSRRKSSNLQVIVREVVFTTNFGLHPREGKENKLSTDESRLVGSPRHWDFVGCFSLGLGVVGSFWKHAKERKRPHFFLCVVCVCFCLGMVVWRQRDVVGRNMARFPKKDMGYFLLAFLN